MPGAELLGLQHPVDLGASECGAHLLRAMTVHDDDLGGAELTCPILAVAERNRASMQSGGISAGAGSRKLEYTPESVWDLQRDPDAAPDAQGEVPVTLRLVKNRNGAAGRKIPLRFHGGLQRFREA